MAALVDRKHHLIEDPPIAKKIFGSTEWAWIWIPLRLFLAYQWLGSAIWNPWTAATATAQKPYLGGKIFQAGWWSGESLMNSWANSLKGTGILYDWYRAFLQGMFDGGHYVWFSKVIMFGEIAVGLGLLLGAFTGIAAWGGSFMNFNFLLAGTASSNGMLFGLEVLIVMGWKVAGYYGLDRWLLPMIGVPWTLPLAEPQAKAAGEPFKTAAAGAGGG